MERKNYSLVQLVLWFLSIPMCIFGQTNYLSLDSICPNHRHPHMIDLGLKSGTVWACCNVGSNSPIDMGGRYRFPCNRLTLDDVFNEFNEDMEERYLRSMDPDYDIYYKGEEGEIWESRQERIQRANVAGLKEDIATSNWGKNWQMPCKEQVEELFHECDTMWVTFTTTPGVLFKSKQQTAFLFLPASDIWNSDVVKVCGFNDPHSTGHYWLSESYDYKSSFALGIYKRQKANIWHYPDKLEFSVRPVSTKKQQAKLQKKPKCKRTKELCR